MKSRVATDVAIFGSHTSSLASCYRWLTKCLPGFLLLCELQLCCVVNLVAALSIKCFVHYPTLLDITLMLFAFSVFAKFLV